MASTRNLILLAALGYAIATRPSETSFDEWFRGWIRKNLERSRGGKI